jgi:hypothetical protein
METPHPSHRPGFVDRLGPRTVRRSEPRFAIALAGAGCALAVLGALLISVDNLDGGPGDGLNRIPGVVLSGLLVAAGLVALANARSGPIATAGVVASALGVPALLVFLTLSESELPPYNTNAILLGSTLAWAVAWAVGPGRGRPFYLGAALIGAWLSLLELVESVFSAPFAVLEGFADGPVGFGDPFDGGGFGDPFGPGSFSQPSVPDPTTVGALSLLLGVAYLVVGRQLDRSGRAGIGTPFAVAVIPCLVVGVIALADDLQQVGTGLLMVVLGAGVAAHAATVGRRLTTWVGGATVAAGLAILLGDMTDDATIGGMLYLAAGVGVVAVAHFAAQALSEPDETVPGPSTFGGPRTPAASPVPVPSTSPAPDQTWAPRPPADEAPGTWAPAPPPPGSTPPPPPPPPSAPPPPPGGAPPPAPPPGSF